MSPPKWRVDDDFVPLSELDDAHLENALFYCQRKAKYFSSMAEALEKERSDRDTSIPSRIKQSARELLSEVGIGL